MRDEPSCPGTDVTVNVRDAPTPPIPSAEGGTSSSFALVARTTRRSAPVWASATVNDTTTGVAGGVSRSGSAVRLGGEVENPWPSPRIRPTPQTARLSREHSPLPDRSLPGPQIVRRRSSRHRRRRLAANQAAARAHCPWAAGRATAVERWIGFASAPTGQLHAWVRTS